MELKGIIERVSYCKKGGRMYSAEKLGERSNKQR